MSDWAFADLFAEIENHQFQTELRASGGKEAVMAERKEKRAAFHCALNDPTVPEATVCLLYETAREFSSPVISEATVTKTRDLIRSGAIAFTRAEPADLVRILAHAFGRLRSVLAQQQPPVRLLVGTDDLYRPHASITLVAPNHYVVLFGRYLLTDLGMVVHLLVEYLQPLFSQSVTPWDVPDFRKRLSDAFEASKYRVRLPYAMASTAEGERFRFGSSEVQGETARALHEHILRGATAFIVGHELGHLFHGDFAPHPPQPTAGPTLFNATIAQLRQMNPRKIDEVLQYYVRNCWANHWRELKADSFGLLCAGGSGPEGASEEGLMGAQLVMCLISFLDRANYLIEKGKDPAIIVGNEGFQKLGFIDLVMPMVSHPWGKTRNALLVSALFEQYGTDFSRSVLNGKAETMLAVQTLFGRSNGAALSIVHHVNQRPGESVAFIDPEDPTKLNTVYWPPGEINPASHQVTVSEAASYYSDRYRGAVFNHIPAP